MRSDTQPSDGLQKDSRLIESDILIELKSQNHGFGQFEEEKYEKFEISMFIYYIEKLVYRNNSFIICLIIIFVIMLVIITRNIFSFVEIP